MTKYRLGDVLTIIMDYRGKTPKKLGLDWTEDKNDIVALSAKNLKNGELINLDKSHYGNSALYNKWMKDGDISVGDILMTSEAPLGELFLVDKPIKAILSQRIFLLRPNNSIVLPWYLYFYMSSKNFQNRLNGHATGTTVIGIKQKELRNIEIELPSLSIQKSIVRKLVPISKKIEINKEINANLYEQIKTISNSHFSYFDFSDGHIPSNWHYTSLSDVAEITTGYSYTSRELHSSKTAMATIKNFERTGGFSDKGYKEIIPQKKLKDSKMARKFDILVAHTDLTQNADIIGNAEIILDTSIYSQLIYSMDLVRVRTKATNVSQFLLSLILQGDRLKKHCLGYVNGTTVLHLSKKALKEFYIPLPNDLHELDHISKFAKAAYMNIAINIQENSMLQEAKQTLLRKFF